MKINLSNIDKNPYRNMQRNPVDQEAVRVLRESFIRNGIWPNIVVRAHPAKPGRYQLAYGHHRLAAMKAEKVTETQFIVEDIDDWGMYTAMVDENEGQKRMTPELVYENIETGIKFIEPIVRKCETVEEFGAKVPRGTLAFRPEEYTKVRNNLLNGEGLGVKFLQQVLPGEKSTRPANIQTVVNSHYEATKAEAKRARAEAKRKMAEAEEDIKKAEKLEREAKNLELQADRLTKYGVDAEILLAFDSPTQMSEFSEAIKRERIPKEKHAALVEHLRNSNRGKGIAGRNYAEEISRWWYIASGQAREDMEQAAARTFARKHKGKDIEEFAGYLVHQIKTLQREVQAVTEYASAIRNQRTRQSLKKRALDLELALNELGGALEDKECLSPNVVALSKIN